MRFRFLMLEIKMSLDGAYDTHNIFAKILRGEAAAHKVYEDDAVIAFLDLFPQSRGHTLVIPKYPARNLFDAPSEVLEGLISRTQKVAGAVVKAVSADGVVITQFNGADAGQTVFHLHFHIIPRFAGVDVGRHASGGPAPADELTALAGAIAAELAASS